MAVDSQRLQDVPLYLTAIWTTPFLLIITTALLCYSIGPASLGGVSLLVVLLVPVNGIYVANKIKKLQVLTLTYINTLIHLSMTRISLLSYVIQTM